MKPRESKRDLNAILGITDGVVDALKQVVPRLIRDELRSLGFEIRAVIPRQDEKKGAPSADLSQDELLAMSARARANIALRHGPEMVRQLDHMADTYKATKAVPPAVAINRATIERLRDEGRLLEGPSGKIDAMVRHRASMGARRAGLDGKGIRNRRR
jgi:hypothetical protein